LSRSLAEHSVYSNLAMCVVSKYFFFVGNLFACVYAGPSPLTKSLRWPPHVGIHSADVHQTVFSVVDPHFGVIDYAGYHPVCVCCSRVCVVIYISNRACQTRNHDWMQMNTTKHGANFCDWTWVAGPTYLLPSHTTWVPVKIVTPIFDKNPGQPSPGLFPPPLEMFLCRRVPRGRWCILLCTLSSNSLEKRVTWQ